jgi:hypothetical protein
MSESIDKQKLLEYLNTQFANTHYGAVSAKIKEIYNEINSGVFDLKDSDSTEQPKPTEVLIESLQQQNKAYEEALQFYADEKNYRHVESAAYSDVALDEALKGAITHE